MSNGDDRTTPQSGQKGIVWVLFILFATSGGLGVLGLILHFALQQIVPEAQLLPRIQTWSWYSLYAAGLFLTGIVALLVGFVLLWVFLPIAVHEKPSWNDWIRSLVLSGGFAFCTVYHYFDWRFWPPLSKLSLGQLATSFPNASEKIVAQFKDYPLAWAVIAALSEAFLAYIVVSVAILIVQMLGKTVNMYMTLADKGGRAVQWVRNSLRETLRQPDTNTAEFGRRQTFPLVCVCLIFNAILLAVALVKIDLTSLGLSLAGITMIVLVLSAVFGSKVEARDLTLSKMVLPISFLTLLSLMCLCLNPTERPIANPVFAAWGSEGINLWKYIVRDIALGVVLVMTLLWFLPNSDIRQPLMAESDWMTRRIWQTMWAFFALRALAIGLSYGVAFVSSGSAEAIPGSVRPVSFNTFAYMAWSGDVLQSDEYLYAAEFANDPNYFKDQDGRVKSENKSKFTRNSLKLRGYYSVYYATLVLIQAVFGWNYGITILSYLLFAYVILLFRDPQPASGIQPAQAQVYAESRMRAGVIDRLREGADAITTLGFIGTLLGLSQAIFFLGASDEVGEFIGKTGISSRLSGSLGLAFFTTFVAMMLRLIINLRFSQLAAKNQGYQALFTLLTK